MNEQQYVYLGFALFVLSIVALWAWGARGWQRVTRLEDKLAERSVTLSLARDTIRELRGYKRMVFYRAYRRRTNRKHTWVLLEWVR